MMEEAIRDASDITQRRKKVPHTCLNTWKVANVGSLPDNFMDPLIPCRSMIYPLVHCASH
jgi:cohesin complex subunit SCC1